MYTYNTKELRVKYKDTLSLLRNLPPIIKSKATNSFLLVKGFDDYYATKQQVAGKGLEKVPVLQEYCNNNHIPISTFYRYRRNYSVNGIEGLKPKYYIKHPFEKIRAKYKNKPITLNAHKEGKKSISIFDIPEVINIIDKRAFNIAFYKYSLFLPFQSSNMTIQETIELKNRILLKEHVPYPGEKLIFSKGSINNYINLIRHKGFAGFIPARSITLGKNNSDTISVKLNVNRNNPLLCLGQLKNFILDWKTVPIQTKAISVKFLNKYLPLVKSEASIFKPFPLFRQLTEEEIEKLIEYKKGMHKNKSAMATALLMANDNISKLEILMVVGRSDKTIYRWIKRLKKEGINFIEGKHNYGKDNEEYQNRTSDLTKLIRHQPDTFNINRPSWAYNSLAIAYEKKYKTKLSPATIGRAVKKIGKWARSK
ncbi:MAG: hypothetical protein P4L45_13985, partial [Ignavibacteriaceae bacterium]|nr:hypothetical protein [Ignavibacteriaceae bacterium]